MEQKPSEGRRDARGSTVGQRLRQRLAGPSGTASDSSQAAFITSPIEWSTTTKLLVGQLGIILLVLLIYALRGMVVPLLIAFITVLLMNPPATWLNQRLGWPWPVCVALSFIGAIAAAAIVGLFYADRFMDALGVVAQVAQTGVDGVQAAIPSETVQALFGEMTTAAADFLGLLIRSTVSSVGKLVFSIATAFFVLIESGGVARLEEAEPVSALTADLRAMRSAITKIWGKWIYAQCVLSACTFIMYLTMMTVLGVQAALGVALVSIVGRFIPNIGAAITWSVVFLAAWTQDSNRFGLESLPYALLCVGISILIDQSFDNFVAPKIYGGAFHLPAALVIVGTFAGGILLGFFGMFTAAPIMASGILVARYVASHIIEVEAAPGGNLSTMGSETP